MPRAGPRAAGAPFASCRFLERGSSSLAEGAPAPPRSEAPGAAPLTAAPHRHYGRPHGYSGRRCPPSRSLRCPSLTPYPFQSSQPSPLNLQDFLLLHPFPATPTVYLHIRSFAPVFLCPSFSLLNATSMPPRSGKAAALSLNPCLASPPAGAPGRSHSRYPAFPSPFRANKMLFQLS